MPVNDLIILRKGTNAEWLSLDPILSSGEPGFDTTNQLLKIGDGQNHWSGLPSIGLPHTGLANYLARWNTNNSLGTGYIYDNGSQIGIGTSNPTHTLHVNGSGLFRDGLTVSDYTFPTTDGFEDQYLQTDGAGNLSWVSIAGGASVEGTGIAGYLSKWNSSDTITSGIIYDDGVNIGIGTSSPSYKLHVNGTAGFSSTIYAPNIGAGTDNSVVILNSAGLFKTDEIDSRVWGSSLVDGTGTSNYISKWSDSNTLTNSIIYDDGTNVGIGTSSPNVKLDVVGSGAFTGNVSVGGKITHPSLTGVNDFIIYSQGDETLISAKAGHVVRIRAGGNDASYETMVSSSYMYIGGNRIRLNSAETTINEFGFNVDFRIEGDTDPNLLFVDASVDDVGIGTNTPAAKLHIAGDTLYENLSYRRFTTSTAVATHFRKYYDIAHYANSVSTVAGSLRIEIPVTTSTMWSMDVVIVEYDGVNGNNIKTTNLTITGYTTSNLNRGVWTNNPSRISQVRFGRNTANNRTVILIDPVSTFRYPKAYIKEINTHHSNETTFGNSANYAITITSDETNFTLNGTITNDQFIRDDKLVNTFGNQTVAGIKNFTGNVGVGTASPGSKLSFGTYFINSNTPTAAETSSHIRLYESGGTLYGLGVSSAALNIAANQTGASIRMHTASAERVRIDGIGNVGIGTSTPAYKLDVNGTFSANSINVNDQFTFPTSDGSSGQSLVTNGSGVVSWTSLTNITRGSFTPSSSQSVFTVNDGYVVGGLDVYYNGIKLLSGTDYTATNGTSFTLNNTAVSGDIVEYVALSAASMDANTIRGSVAASDGQTVFNVSGGYTVGNLDVFLNGIKLLDGTDFTATNGTSITLTSAAALGDVLEYNAYGLVVASNGLQKTGDTMTGNLTIGSNSILFDSSVIDNNSLDINICNGRLTLESGVPVSTTDQTAKTTVYFAPYNGNRICLYDTSLNKWKMHSFSQLSLSLSGLVANTNYDVFIYNNSGTLILETTAWTDNTTRATELTTQDNIYVKTGSVNRRYLGTIRTTNTAGQCEDSVTKRFVWNYYNREERLLRKYIYGSWTYATAAWRVFAGAAASTYSIDVVTGLSQDSIFLKAGALYTAGFTTLTYYYIAIAQDSSLNIIDIGNTNNAVERVQSNSSNQTQLVSELDHIVPLGYHYYYPIEYRESGGTPTMYATDTTYWGGLLGTWRC